MINQELLHSVRCCLTQAIARYQHVHGKNPDIILAESRAYELLLHDGLNSRYLRDGTCDWRGYPVKLVASDGLGIWLPVEPVRLEIVKKGESRVFRYREEETRNG